MQLAENVRRYLSHTRFAVLATLNQDGTPQQTVMWYDVDGDEILMNTTAQRIKNQNLRRDPHASVCVPDGYRYVTITGKVRLVEDAAIGQEDIRRLAIRYHGEQEGNRQSAEVYSQQQRITIRLTPERVVAYHIDDGD